MEAQLRQSVRARAAYQCEYCRLPQEFSELRFHIEHVIPRQHGGGDDVDNLALACPDCNLRKGPNLTGIDSLTGEVVRLFHPRHDVWSGRTTVSLLQMNDAERRRVRELIANIQG